MSGAALAADGWAWRHAGRVRAAVQGLDLAIAPGERVLLLGASGAGKSTLLRAFAGVLGDDEGDGTGVLLVDGRDPRAARGRVGLVQQSPESNIVLERVGDDIAFGCENLGIPADVIWRRVGEALEAVGLDVPLDASTSTLSGGQQQRLAVAGVLAMAPGAIVLDEPTANVDPDGVPAVRDAVLAAAARTGATLLVVEHRVEVWRDVVDRIVVLEAAGGVVADGPPHEVLRSHGSALAATGIWVPGFVPREPLAPRPGGEALLEALGLSVARGGRTVSSGIEFALRQGAALAVTGANGAGKTTLALTAGGLLPPAAGILTAREPLARRLGAAPMRWRSRDLLPRIGSVFQQPEHQFLKPSVRAELAVGPKALRLPEPTVRHRVDEVLERLRLSDLADANPFTLSGGEQRRLSVATALTTRPDVLVVDEPTFGQDALTWAGLVDLFRALLAEGRAVLAVTHDGAFADALGADRLRLTVPA